MRTVWAGPKCDGQPYQIARAAKVLSTLVLLAAARCEGEPAARYGRGAHLEESLLLPPVSMTNAWLSPYPPTAKCHPVKPAL